MYLILLWIAGSNAQPPPLQDPVLDNFAGEWWVERNMGKRGVKQTTVHCEWVLNHQFIRLHYGTAGADGDYEAFVFIGFDEASKNYVCLWVDVFGGAAAEVGRGALDDTLHSLEFKFGKGELTNKFTFDPQTKTWTSLIRQIEKGQWVTFAEEKWTKK